MTKPMVKKLQLGHARRLPVRPETIHQFMLNFITRTSRACQRMNIKAKLSYTLKMIKNNVRMTKIIVEQPELDSKQIVTRSSRACQRMNIKAKLSYALKMIKNNVRMTKIIVEQPELDSKQIVTRSS